MGREFRSNLPLNKIKTVFSQLSAIRDHFNLSDDFIFVAGRLLAKHFENLKNTKTPVITARIFRLTRDYIGKYKISTNTNMRQVCDFLGVRPSNCSYSKFKDKLVEDF